MIDYLLWLGSPLLLNLFVYVYRTNNRTTMRLKGMSLQPGSNFVNKKLRFAQLQGLDLSGSNFSGANLECANLSGANLTGSNLEGCCFERASLRNANCSKANLMQVCVRWADIDGANFDGATINGMKIYEDQIEKAVNLNANVLDVYDRRTNERIKSLKQILVQDKLRHSEAARGSNFIRSQSTTSHRETPRPQPRADSGYRYRNAPVSAVETCVGALRSAGVVCNIPTFEADIDRIIVASDLTASLNKQLQGLPEGLTPDMLKLLRGTEEAQAREVFSERLASIIRQHLGPWLKK